ncbi:MAG: hypothetical protein JXJ04_02310 [Spirochaetales bacterium]|nr:hypothetical protein [Spirochaetales bacterium]
MDDVNITLVAFHGNQKPPALQNLLSSIDKKLMELLGSSYSTLYKPFTSYQIHATLIGMEVDLVTGELHGHWFLKNHHESAHPVTLRNFIPLLSSLAEKNPLFRIRFCGYRKAYCTCKNDEFDDWNCRTSAAEFHSCGRSAYEGTFYGFSPGPVMISGWPIAADRTKTFFPHDLYFFRRRCEKAGFCDKYHSDTFPTWKDDDCYIKIGEFLKEIPSLPDIIEKLRIYMSEKEPVIIDILPENAAVVFYTNSTLAENTIIKKITLPEAVNDPDSLTRLFQEIKQKKRIDK